MSFILGYAVGKSVANSEKCTYVDHSKDNAISRCLSEENSAQFCMKHVHLEYSVCLQVETERDCNVWYNYEHNVNDFYGLFCCVGATLLIMFLIWFSIWWGDR